MKAVDVNFNDLDEEVEAVRITTVDNKVLFVSYDGEVSELVE